MNTNTVVRHARTLKVAIAPSIVVIGALAHFAHAADKEWTMERAKAEWETIKRPVMHLGMPGYQWQAGVLWDGSLLFGRQGYSRNKPAVIEEAASLGNNEMHLSIGYGNPMQFYERRWIGTSTRRQRSLVENRLPLAQIQTTEDSGLEWNQTVFAHLLDRKPSEAMAPRADDVLVVHSLFDVVNASDRRQTAHLWVYCGDSSQTRLGYKTRVRAQIDRPLDHRFVPPLGILQSAKGANVRYVIPPPEKGRLEWRDDATAHQDFPALDLKVKNLIHWEVPLAAGENARLRLLVPCGLIDRGQARRVRALDSDAKQQEVQAFWKGLLTRASKITTPDRWFTDYTMAAGGHELQQIVYRHKADLWMFKTSPNQYEIFWLVCGGRALPSLDLRGLSHLTEPVLQSYIGFQGDDIGNLEIRLGTKEKAKGEGFAIRDGFFGHQGDWTANPIIWGHGLALWDLAAHYRITRDRAWLGEGEGSPLESILKACDWLMVQRRRTMREEDGQRVAHWGLLPAASVHDWLIGSAVINDAYCVFAMAECARLLREIDHPRAEEMAREVRDWRECLRKNYEAARDRAKPRTLPDGTSLPFVPRVINQLDWTKEDWSATSFGMPRAGSLGALDPNGELISQTIAFLETPFPEGQGLYIGTHHMPIEENTADVSWQRVARQTPSGWKFFEPWRHYIDYEINWPLTDLFLERDDLPRFFECFFNSFAVIDHPWKTGAESIDGVPACAPSEAMRWEAVRDMFVSERGGYDGSQQKLFLLQAIPQSWLLPGLRLAAQDMRTHFGGSLDLDARVADDGRSLNVNAALDLAVAPAEIKMRLRSGRGRRLVSATINGAATKIHEQNAIRLPAEPKGTYEIVGHFE